LLQFVTEFIYLYLIAYIIVMLNKIKIFNNEIRKSIYNYILLNPGVHLRDLERKLNINVFNLKYHIRILEKNNYLIEKKEEGFLRFFVPHKISNGEKMLFFYLRQKTSRDIILITLYNVATSQREICEFTHKSPSTINFHITKLLENDIIEIAPSKNGIIQRIITPRIMSKKMKGREIVFRLKDPATIYRLFNEYSETLFDDDTKIIFDAIKYTVIYGNPNVVNRKFGTDNHEVLVEYFFEIFPHPYHV